MPSSSASQNPPSAPEGYSAAKRIPTDSSYYDFHGVPYLDKDPNSSTWMYARDARAQMATEPQKQGRKDRYPGPFWNREDKPLSTPGSKLQTRKREEHGWMHHPLTPGTGTAYSGSGDAGGVRAIYTKDDSKNFDVYYHDRTSGTTGDGTNGIFERAKYYPKASK
ncbi:hypothetical protein F4777DRAFT_563249 [Nemania sp. FL0916]|nr:hypothetical protein F4777DRAFT_563249 [Nemania sp. FL0916]